MRPSTHQGNNHQTRNIGTSRKEKKQTNIKWNSRIYFQVGLILCLLGAFFIMEMDFELKKVMTTAKSRTTIEEPGVFHYRVEPPKIVPVKNEPKKEPQQRKKQEVITNVIKVDNSNSMKTDTEVTPTDTEFTDEGPKIDAPITPEVPTTPGSILGVQFAPVFPGCETAVTNQDKIACMSSKVSTFISRKFNSEKFGELEPGTKRIVVQFTIDASGYVTDVKARAESEALQKEATRVVGGLPKMRPGRQGIANVSVLYSVPILFRVE